VVANRDDAQTLPLVAADSELITWGLTEPGEGAFGLSREAANEYLCLGPDALMPVSELGLAGRHNVANALAALAIGHAGGLPLPAMVETLRVFGGLPHRCERLADIAGVRYVNDSKGTNIGATEAALLGLGGDRDIVLIAGGQGKGADFSRLRPAVSRHCKALVLMGEDAPLLQRALAGSAPVVLAASLQEAFEFARERAIPGDTVLLSPACASFDMFSGYEERGEAFRTLVQQQSEALA
jgi:UDP-N-acetylmuramoylalanine--D-glutamate ligase